VNDLKISKGIAVVNGKIDAISFSPDGKMVIAGFGLFGFNACEWRALSNSSGEIKQYSKRKYTTIHYLKQVK
jgi:hypothetical protein